VTNNAVTITRYTGDRERVCIPETIDGHPVTTLGDEAFAYCESLVSVIMPPGITTIGESAFDSCASLTSLTISTNVTSIGDGAFLGCSSLTDLTIPAGVSIIRENVFGECSSLAEIRIPEGVEAIEMGAFYDCETLTTVTLPASVTNIAGYAFIGCYSLTEITIPTNVAMIDEEAFAYCDNLRSVYCKGDAPSYGDNIFAKSSDVTVYSLPESSDWTASFGDRPVVAWNPQVNTDDADFGMQTNHFGFNITHTNDLTVIVEESEDLANPAWTPIGLHTLSKGSTYFSDTGATNQPARFYRLSMP
jgi:hypothetical protein